MNTNEKIERLLMDVGLKLGTKNFLTKLRERYFKNGELTAAENSAISRIYDEHFGKPKLFNVPAFQQTTDQFRKHESIFSEEEISEHFKIIKMVITNQISKHDTNLYCKAITSVLESKGVKAQEWEN